MENTQPEGEAEKNVQEIIHSKSGWRTAGSAKKFAYISVAILIAILAVGSMYFFLRQQSESAGGEAYTLVPDKISRSEERRVGKECRL